MPDKPHFFRLFRVVTNSYLRANRIFRFKAGSEIRLLGIAFSVNNVLHDRVVKGIRYTAERGIIHFQSDHGCLYRHGALYVRKNLCHNQKQTDSGNYNADN